MQTNYVFLRNNFIESKKISYNHPIIEQQNTTCKIQHSQNNFYKKYTKRSNYYSKCEDVEVCHTIRIC